MMFCFDGKTVLSLNENTKYGEMKQYFNSIRGRKK